MKLLKDYCYNPFFTDVNGKRLEIGNILFFDRSGVICATGRGWFSIGIGSNNEFKNGLELPTECVFKHKVDFSLSSAFVVKQKQDELDHRIHGNRYELYIPADAVGLKAPTVCRSTWDTRHFEITYLSDIPGVGVIVWHFVDAALHPIESKIQSIGESLSRIYHATPEAIQAKITELTALKEEFSKEYEKMLAITPDEVLQARRAK